MKTYPTVRGAPTGIRNRNGGMSRAAPFRTGLVRVLPSGAWSLSTRVGAAWGCFPLGAVGTVLATLLEVAPEEGRVVEARLVGTRGAWHSELQQNHQCLRGCRHRSTQLEIAQKKGRAYPLELQHRC